MSVRDVTSDDELLPIRFVELLPLSSLTGSFSVSVDVDLLSVSVDVDLLPVSVVVDLLLVSVVVDLLFVSVVEGSGGLLKTSAISGSILGNSGIISIVTPSSGECLGFASIA